MLENSDNGYDELFRNVLFICEALKAHGVPTMRMRMVSGCEGRITN